MIQCSSEKYKLLLYFVNPSQITIYVTELNLIDCMILINNKKIIKRFSELSSIFIKFVQKNMKHNIKLLRL